MESPAESPAAVYERLIVQLCDALRGRGAGSSAPARGTVFPEFALPDAEGRLRRLSEFLAKGPLVISFMRGQWCPYCTEELRAWDAAFPDLRAKGGNLLCVVAATGGAAAAIEHCVAPGITVLCDVDHGLALALGLTFHIGSGFLDRYRARGLDLAEVYGTAAGLLPIPATFALAQDGTVLESFIEPDFRIRAAPEAMIAAISARGH